MGWKIKKQSDQNITEIKIPLDGGGYYFIKGNEESNCNCPWYCEICDKDINIITTVAGAKISNWSEYYDTANMEGLNRLKKIKRVEERVAKIKNNSLAMQKAIDNETLTKYLILDHWWLR